MRRQDNAFVKPDTCLPGPMAEGHVRAEIAVTSVPVVPHPEEEDRKMLRELVGEGCRQG